MIYGHLGWSRAGPSPSCGRIMRRTAPATAAKASRPPHRVAAIRWWSWRRVPQVGKGDRAAANGLVGQLASTAARAGGDAELVVEPQQVLLYRGLGDDQCGGDLVQGRRLGEHLTADQGPTQRAQYITLATGQLRRRRCSLGSRGSCRLRRSVHQLR